MIERARDRLVGWKAIGNFVGRDARTVRRWEADRGLPVHRAPGGDRPMVWADPAELDRWLSKVGAAPESLTSTDDRGDRRAVWKRIAAAAVLTFVVLAGIALGVPRAVPTDQPFAANAASRELYLRGTYAQSTRTAAGLAEAAELFGRLTRIEPSEAAGFVGLADTWLLMREFAAVPDEAAYPRALAAARRALALEPRNARAKLSIAFIRFWWLREPDGALADFRAAVAALPNDAGAHLWYANALSARARYVEAQQVMAKARALDPASRAIAADAAWLRYLAGDIRGAYAAIDALIRLEPDFAASRRHRALMALYDGNGSLFLSDAMAAAGARSDDRALALLRAAADVRRAEGDRAMARALAGNGYAVTALDRAELYALAGDGPAARDWLRRSFEAREPALVALPMQLGLLALVDDPVWRRAARLS